MPRYLLLTSGVFSALMLIGVAVAIPALNTSKSIATDTSESCDQYNDPKNCFSVKPTKTEVSVVNYINLV